MASRLRRGAAATATLCLVAPTAWAGAVFGLSGVGLEGLVERWDAAPRTVSGLDRSLSDGLSYAVSGGSMQAFRDQFAWSGAAPSVVSFQVAVQQAFDAWGTTDPVSHFGSALSFRYDANTAVVGVIGGGADFRGAEIDLIAATDAFNWNPGNTRTQGETWVSTVPSPVTLTSGVVAYANSTAISGVDIYVNSNPGAVYTLDLFRRLLTHEIGHALGLGDAESTLNQGRFIDDNFAGAASAATTLNNNWAGLVDPLDPAHSGGLQFFDIGSATSTAGVDLLMESNGLGISSANPVTSLVPLTNDEYSTRQFLYPFLAAVPEATMAMQWLAGLALLAGLMQRRRPRR